MSDADICLILEGQYPFQRVATARWVHELIHTHANRTFHLVTLSHQSGPKQAVFDLPANVVGHTDVVLGRLPAGRPPKGAHDLPARLQPPLSRLLGQGGPDDLRALLALVAPLRDRLGEAFLLNSPATWEMLRDMYEQTMPASSFIDYFWSWRSLVAAIFSALLFPLPRARLYHGVSAGYADLVLARAALESRRPTLLSELGSYLSERRIETSMSDWLFEVKSKNLARETISHRLRRLWINTFSSLSRACYASVCEVVARYEDPRNLQQKQKAGEDRLRIIADGVDMNRFLTAYASKPELPPTIAMIGRVVPRKDVLTFIRAADILRGMLPGIRVWLLGSLDDDPPYVAQCRRLVAELGLTHTVHFLGEADVPEHLRDIHVVVSTSISETQPRALLEAGAAGIPCVATDVGACREILMGGFRENPPLGPGGEITAPASPDATAQAVYLLLEDHPWYDRCAATLHKRVQLYYNKKLLDRAYTGLYTHYLAQPDGGVDGEFPRWTG